MTFRHDAPCDAFAARGAHGFAEWTYDTTDPLERGHAARLFRPRLADLAYG